MISIIFSLTIILFYIILLLIDEKKALALIPALSPLYLIRFSILSFPTTLLEILILVALIRFAWSKPWQRINLTSTHVAILILFLAVTVIGVVTANNTVSALGIAKAYYIEPLLLFVAFYDRFSKQDIIFALHALGISACLLTLFGIFQWMTGMGLPIPYDFTRRITSIFPYPNAYGLFVAPLATAFFVFAYYERRKIYVALAGFLFIGLFLSQTEAGIIAVIASLLILFFILQKSIKKRAIIAIASFCIIVLALLIPTMRAKLLLQDTSGMVRRNQWQETIVLVKDNPVFGVGFNEYPKAFIPYHHTPQYEIFQYPHQLILNAWIEAGIANVILVLIGLIFTIHTLWRKKTSAISLVFCAGLLAMFIHGMADVPFYKNDLAVITALFFVGVMIVNIENK